MNIEYFIPAVLFLLCLVLRSIYELLKEARRINTESKPIFISIFSAMCILWISWFSLCPADPFRVDLPDAIHWTGFAVFIIGMILAVGALIQLRGVENIDHLVTTGLFKKVRHPMYAGFIAWILGWSVYHGALISLAIGLPGIASILWWRHLEETRLEVQFGNSYIQYRLTTWF
jgi:protein-S-isoprenylcysteine O-methyltransferase Ste14